jgi:hypothetical protein
MNESAMSERPTGLFGAGPKLLRNGPRSKKRKRITGRYETVTFKETSHDVYQPANSDAAEWLVSMEATAPQTHDGLMVLARNGEVNITLVPSGMAEDVDTVSTEGPTTYFFDTLDEAFKKSKEYPGGFPAKSGGKKAYVFKFKVDGRPQRWVRYYADMNKGLADVKKIIKKEWPTGKVSVLRVEDPVQTGEIEEGELQEAGLASGLTKGEKKVVRAFTEKKPADSKRLSTDGERLSIHGSGTAAQWKGGKIHMGPNVSRSTQAVQRALRREAPKNWIVEGIDDDELQWGPVEAADDAELLALFEDGMNVYGGSGIDIGRAPELATQTHTPRPGGRSATQDTKDAKPDVNYQTATGKERCGNCVSFRPRDKQCEAVAGAINPKDVCDIWAPTTEDIDESTAVTDQHGVKGILSKAKINFDMGYKKGNQVQYGVTTHDGAVKGALKKAGFKFARSSNDYDVFSNGKADVHIVPDQEDPDRYTMLFVVPKGQKVREGIEEMKTSIKGVEIGGFTKDRDGWRVSMVFATREAAEQAAELLENDDRDVGSPKRLSGKWAITVEVSTKESSGSKVAKSLVTVLKKGGLTVSETNDAAAGYNNATFQWRETAVQSYVYQAANQAAKDFAKKRKLKLPAGYDDIMNAGRPTVQGGTEGTHGFASVGKDGVPEAFSVSDENELLDYLSEDEAIQLEVSPPGFSGVTKAMKDRHPEIDNPYALAWSMYKAGAKPRIKPEKGAKGKTKYIPPAQYQKLAASVQQQLQGIDLTELVEMPKPERAPGPHNPPPGQAQVG